ncbi:MAG: zinc carboxypeptidase, partial [candidate division Zixibacteria bacterium]|nr:zinc carboxypeptidase [candidate division Zixibacteria bacterium]
MKKLYLVIPIVLILLLGVVQAKSNETYFKFQIDSRQMLDKISRVISIDKVDGLTVYAYANDEELSEFRQYGYAYEVLPHPGTLIQPEMSSDKADILDWDTYPTYDAYVSMMNQFAIDYPSLCQVHNVGSSVEGRAILFLEISDNVGVEEDEPEVMYTATMHGDETAGYVIMLRLADSLLTAYGTDS